MAVAIVTAIAIGVLATALLGCVFYLGAVIYDWWERRKIRIDTAAEMEMLRRIQDQQWADDEAYLEASLEVLRALMVDVENLTDLEEIERCLDAANEIIAGTDLQIQAQAERAIADWMAVVPTVEPERTLPPNLRRAS